MGCGTQCCNPMVLREIPMNSNYKIEPAITGYLQASRSPHPLAMDENRSVGLGRKCCH